MKFKDVKEGMFFYRTDRGLILFVDEVGEYNIDVYVYDSKWKNFVTNTYHASRWDNTLWGNEGEAANPKYVAHKMIMGLFEVGKIKYEV